MEQKFCELKLSKEDARFLKKMLEVRLLDLRTELVRTDSLAFQRALRSDLNRLEGIYSELSRLVTGLEQAA